MSQRFVLVSTGQNVANLPPLLEFANEGDEVVWIESKEASEGKWTEGARRVLDFHRLRQSQTVRVRDINDPSEIVRVLKAETAGWDHVVPTTVVLNGGRKFTPIGVLFGLKDFAPVAVYGNDPPAEYRRFESSFEQSPTVAPYSYHELDLEEILACKGYRIENPTSAIRFWPGAEPFGFFPPDYGTDSGYSLELHRKYHGGTARAGDLRIGDVFEGAVARQVYHWLERYHRDAVQSAWANVQVVPIGDASNRTTQLDVVLVLKNAILLHLECKSHESNKKDLDARILNLRNVSSQLARLVIGMPIYTGAAAEDWFRLRREKVDTLERQGFTVLPFTLPGQPVSYSWTDSAGLARTDTCASFESHLDDLLRPYRPSAPPA